MIYYLNLEGITTLLGELATSPTKLVMFIVIIISSCVGHEIGRRLYRRIWPSKDID
jgi:hypothetical protein